MDDYRPGTSGYQEVHLRCVNKSIDSNVGKSIIAACDETVELIRSYEHCPEFASAHQIREDTLGYISGIVSMARWHDRSAFNRYQSGSTVIRDAMVVFLNPPWNTRGAAQAPSLASSAPPGIPQTSTPSYRQPRLQTA